MIWIWIVGAAWLALITTVAIKSTSYDRGDLTFLSTIFGGFVAVMIFLGLNGLCLLSQSSYTETVRGCDLQRLQLSSETNGRFFLGSGSIHGEAAYLYFCKGEPGVFEASSVEVSNARIVERSDETPHVIMYRNNYRSNSHLWTIFNTPGRLDRYKIDLVIPPGTVMQNYSVDGK
jgi:hypothetical protein